MPTYRFVLALACAASLSSPASAQSVAADASANTAPTLVAAPARAVTTVEPVRVLTSQPPATPDTAPAPTDVHPGFFSGLFSPLGSDFRHLASRDSALILGLGGAAALAVHPLDHHLSTSMSKSETTEDAFDAGSPIGSGFVQVGAALGAYVVGRVGGNAELAHVGADLFRAQLIDTAMVQGIKLSTNRTRPDGSDYSFPSGHTSSAFTTASVLQRHYGWKVGLPAYAVASYVGGARIADNRHYLSDVVFGAALGIVAGHAVTVGHGSHQFALTPIAVPGGAGIGFVHLGR